MHEMPSFAAKREAFIKKYKRQPTPAEEKMLRDQGVTEAVTPSVHRKTRTYGGRNTKKQYGADAEDLKKAQRKDEADLSKIKDDEK